MDVIMRNPLPEEGITRGGQLDAERRKDQPGCGLRVIGSHSLYYRLNVFPITVPPLRERGEDIPLLVWTFAKQFGQALGKPVERIPQATMTALRRYPWPGKIRELRNVIERAVILSESSTLQVPMEAAIMAETAPPPTLAAAERGQILAALEQTGWRSRGPAGTAALSGLKPTTLESRIKKLGLKCAR